MKVKSVTFTLDGGKKVEFNFPKKWSKESLEQYLDFHKFFRPGYLYPNSETMIQLFGKYYKHQQLPKEYERGPLGECFDNCARLLLKHNNLQYVEGIATFDGTLPIWHAWCVVEGTKQVIDPTWQVPLALYKGIPIKKGMALSFIFDRGSVLGINDLQSNRYEPPIWKLPLKPEEWIINHHDCNHSD